MSSYKPGPCSDFKDVSESTNPEHAWTFFIRLEDIGGLKFVYVDISNTLRKKT